MRLQRLTLDAHKKDKSQAGDQRVTFGALETRECLVVMGMEAGVLKGSIPKAEVHRPLPNFGGWTRRIKNYPHPTAMGNSSLLLRQASAWGEISSGMHMCRD